MLVILMPFALMTALLEYERAIRIDEGVVVIGVGLWIAFTRRHPRFLSRVPPTRLALWSLLVALAHGAALMLVPIYLGLCAVEELDAGHRAASEIMRSNAGLSVLFALAHTAAMMGVGGALAFAVYKWRGLKFIAQSWLNLELIWALSLILVGAIGLRTAI